MLDSLKVGYTTIARRMQAPSRQDVLADLLELRKYEGLTFAAAADATHVHATKIVANELQSRGGSEDAVTVTRDVIRCIASSDIIGGQFREVLVAVLNCNQDLGPRLTQRRADLMMSLPIGRDELARTEKNAFEELAGLLVTLERSPCGPNADVGKQSRLAERNRLDRVRREEDALRSIEAGVALLRLDRSDEEARRRALEIIQRIPRAVQYFGLDEDDPRRALKFVLERLVYWQYERWAANYPGKPHLIGVPQLLVYLDTFDRTTREIDDAALERVLKQFGTVTTYRDLGHPFHLQWGVKIDDPAEAVRSFIDTSLRFLLTIAVSFELNDEWATVAPA